MDALKGILLMLFLIVVGTPAVVFVGVFIDEMLTETSAPPASTRDESALKLTLQENLNPGQITAIEQAAVTIFEQCGLSRWEGDIEGIHAEWRSETPYLVRQYGWYDAVLLKIKFASSTKQIPYTYGTSGHTCYFDLGEGFQPGIDINKTPCQKICDARAFVPLSGQNVVAFNKKDPEYMRRLDMVERELYDWSDTQFVGWSERDTPRLYVSLRDGIDLTLYGADVFCDALKQQGLDDAVIDLYQMSESDSWQSELPKIGTAACGKYRANQI